MLEIARLVVVAFVVVEFPVMMRFPTKVEDAAFTTMPDVVAEVPVVGWLHASYEKSAPVAETRQVPFCAKQPPFSCMPLAKVEDAEVEVMLSAGVCTPAAKVEVADARMVVVALPFATERMVVEAPPVNCCSALQVFAFPRLSPKVTLEPPTW